MITKHLTGRHVAVTHETVTVRRPGEPTQHRELRDGELADLLDELAVPLTATSDRTAGAVAGLRASVPTEWTLSGTVPERPLMHRRCSRAAPPAARRRRRCC